MRPAATEVARHPLLHLFERRSGVSRQQRFGGHDHAVGAIAALSGLLRNEGCLHRVRSVGRSETFERRDLTTGDAAYGLRAGAHGSPVEQHRAGAALSEATPELRAVQRERTAKGVEEWLRRVPAVD